MSEPTKLESALDELLAGKTTEEIVGPGGSTVTGPSNPRLFPSTNAAFLASTRRFCRCTRAA